MNGFFCPIIVIDRLDYYVADFKQMLCVVTFEDLPDRLNL